MIVSNWLGGLYQRLLTRRYRRHTRRPTARIRHRRSTSIPTLPAWVENLEERVLLAAVSWDGGAGNNLWNSPDNWSGNVVPGANDDVTIDIAGTNTIQLTSGNITIKSLHSLENLEISGAALRVTAGASDISGSLTLTDATLTVEGATADFEATGTTTLTGASLLAKAGGTLSLSAATTYSAGTTSGDRFLQAESGGTLDLPNVTTLTANTQGYTTYIRAYGGGDVLLPGLTAITNNAVNVYAEDAGSNIDLSGLVTWSGRSSVSNRTSNLETRAGTTIDISKLTKLEDTTLTIDGRDVTLSALTDVTGSNLIVRGAAGVLHLPSLTNYHAGTTFGDRVLQAESGGTLDLSQVTSLTANVLGYTTYIRAYGGGDVLLPGLATITNNAVNVYAEDSGSNIDLSGLTTWTGRSSVSNRTSNLETRAGTTIDISKLTKLEDTTLTIDGRDVTLSALTDVTGSNLIVRGAAGVLHLPSLTNYHAGTTFGDRVLQAESGGTLDLSQVTSLTANVLGYTTYIRAYGGGDVLLPGLATITNNAVNVYAEDSGSNIDLSGLTMWTGRSSVSNRTSNLEMRTGTTIDISKLTKLEDTTLTIDGRDVTLSALTDVTGSNLIVRGAAGVLHLPSLTNYHAGTTFGDRVLQAESGGTLDLSQVTSLTANVLGYTTYIRAYGGGDVLLPGLATITNNSVNVYAENAGSGIDLSGLTTWNGRSNVNGRTSTVDVREGTTLLLAALPLSTTYVGIRLASDVTISPASLTLGTGSILAGTGTVDGDVFNTAGTVNPDFDIDGLTILGNYTQGAAAVLQIDLNGTVTGAQFDQLNVAGAATLAGTLRIQSANVFLIPSGQVSQVVTFASSSGSFNPITGSDLGSGISVVPIQTTTNVTLQTFAPIVAAGSAASSVLPSIAGDGVHIDLFNGTGGGVAPTAAALVGKTPSGETLSSVIDFPNPGVVTNVGNNFDTFFSSTTTPPDQVQGLAATNFTLRSDFFLRVSADLDKIPSTPEIDILLGVGSDDGYSLTVGNQFLGSTGDRSFGYTYRWATFAAEGMYPVQLLYSANATGQSGLEFLWDTATSGGAKIVPQSALYVSAQTGDRGVTFDELAAGTVVTDQYRNLGVIFNNVSGNLQATSAHPGQFVPVSPTRVYGDPGASPAVLGKVSASFVVPGTTTAATTNFVSFYVIDAETTGATVQAFDPQGNLIFDQAYHGGGGSQQKVTIVNPRIARVEITLGQGADTSAIDNFTFNLPLSQPDLVVDSVVPATLTAHFGTTLDLSWITRNIGIGTVPNGWTEKVWLSTDNVLDAFDVQLAVRPSDVSSLISQGFINASTTVSLPATGTEGTYYLIVETDTTGAVTEASELNTAVSGPINVTFTPLPDLSPSNVAPSVTTAAPGVTIHVTWVTLNSGSALPAGSVTEQVYLSDDNVVGNDRLIGTFTFDSVGPGAPRDVTITLPTFGIGSGGSFYLVVKTDTGAAIEESNELDNSAVSATAVSVPLQLALTLPTASVPEDGAALHALLTRTGSTALPLTVTLTSSDPNELAVPTTVVIPAGQSGVSVDLTPVADHVPDGNKPVSVTATATGFTSSTAGLTVVDVDTGDLTLDIPADTLTEGASLTATLTRSYVTSQPLVVNLTNSSGSQVSAPTTVIIPANAASVTFVVQAFENFVPEPTATVSVTASATGHHATSDSLQVIDNDLPTLSLALNRATISEGDGISALTATVSRAVATSQPLTVSVSIAGSSKLLVPPIVTIPANQTSISFDLNVIDNLVADGNQTATILAVGLFPADGTPIESSQASAQILIQDNDGPTLSLALDRHFVGEGQAVAATATLTRNTDTTLPLVVTLTSSDTSEATVPVQVTIPAGAASVTFDVASIADGLTDGSQTVAITASASGFATAFESLTVSDDDLPDLVVSQLTAPAAAITDTFVDVTFDIKNVGRKDAAGTLTQRVLLSTDPFIGNDVVIATYTFTGVLKNTAPLDHFGQTVPIQLPKQEGDYWLIVETDANNSVLEGMESNNARISASPIHVQAAYSATVQTFVDTALVNTPIPLVGGAVAAVTGLPAPFALVNIDILVGGVKRTISAITDATGQFSTTFKPLPGEAGNYTIAAYHPGSHAGAPQDSFSILGMAAEPPKVALKLIEQYPAVQGDVTIRNLSDVPLNAVNVQIVGAPTNVTAVVTLGNGNSNQLLIGNGTLNLHCTISATDDSIKSGTVLVRITSAEGATLDLPIQVTVESLRPHLVTSTDNLVSGIVRGQQRLVEFTVTNDGGVETGPMTLQLPNVPWITSPTGLDLPKIFPGQSQKIVIQLLPPADLALGEYTGNLILAMADSSLSVPFTFRNLSEAKGDLSVDVVDEYTYYAEGAPHLAGAKVTLTDTLTGIVVFTGISDATGRLLVPALVEGYYDLHVEADKHTTYDETILVEAGKTNSVQPFLSRQTVSYVWTVEPTEIADRTKITVTSTFETNVPLPVVVVEGGIDLALVDSVTGEGQYEIVIRNEGLIAAQNVKIELPEHPSWTFTPLISGIAVLPAHSSITIPIVVKRNYMTIGAGGPPTLSSLEDDAVDFNQDFAFTLFQALAATNPTDNPLSEASLSQFIGSFESMSASDVDSGVKSQGGDVSAAEDNGFFQNLWQQYLDASKKAQIKEPETQTKDNLKPLEDFLLWANSVNPLKYTKQLFARYLGRAGNNTAADPNAIGPEVDTTPTEAFDTNSEVAKLAKASATYQRMYQALWEGRDADGKVDESKSLKKIIEDYLCNGKTPPATLTTQGLSFTKGGPFDLAYAFGTMADHREGVDRKPYVEIQINKLGERNGPCGQKLVDWDATLIFHQFDYYDFTVDGIQVLDKYGWASKFASSIDIEQKIERSTLDCSKGLPTGPCQTAGKVSYTYSCGGNNVPNGSQFPINNAACGCTGQGQGAGGGGGVAAHVANAVVAGGSCAQHIVVLGSAQSSGTAAEPVETTDASGGVCARVELSLSQDLIQTRDAFGASLDIVNLSDGALANVAVDIVVTDANGRDVTDLFEIRAPALSGVDAVDGTGTVGSGTTGSVRWLIVPTAGAASTGPVSYTVSGVLRYADNGSNVAVQLAGVAITVLPTPSLQVHYFHQRDVLGDDPFTPQVEPSQPYDLAVMIENVGYGSARDVSLATAQPQIIGNEKGLLIGFQILATEVQGQNLTPSLIANFGTIAAGDIAQARWLMTSTLQGQFVDYKATFVNVDGLGKKRLSLVDSVDIHELIHLVTAGGTFDDGKFDYLVNDIPDAHDTPDTLWLSNGDVMPVAEATGEATDGEVTPGDLEVTLTATVGAGWNFIELADPGNGLYHLTHVLRSDGVEIPIGDNITGGNAWETDRTFIEHGQRPTLENKLHILDFGGTGQYTLVYAPNSIVGPSVTSVTGADPVVTAPVDSLTVTFSKPIDAATLTAADLVLTRTGDGANLITGPVSIVQLDETSFRIEGLAVFTATDGDYHFTFKTTGIADLVGNPGQGQGELDWTKASDVPAVSGISGIGSSPRNTPVDAVDVTFTQPIDLSTLSTEDLSLVRGGAAVPLSGASLSFTQTGPTTYRIAGLGSFTTPDGDYKLTVVGAGINDPNGTAGIGAKSASWTMDTIAPAIGSLSGLPAGVTRSGAGSVEVTFSEPINSSTFTAGDIHLTRNGIAVDTSTLTINALSPIKFQIGGLAALTAAEGSYLFSLDGVSITDVAGNAGTGSKSQSWTVDSSAPSIAHDLTFSPDTGVTGDGKTNALSIVLSGLVDEPGVTVDVFDLTNAQSLGAADLTGLSFTKAIDFTVVGNHQLRVRVTDAAGNFADSFCDVFVDQTAPVIDHFVGVSTSIDAIIPNSIDIVFSEPVDATTFDRSDLSLKRNGGADLLPAVVDLTQIDAKTFRLAGLGGLLGADGAYALSVDLTGITDLAGNAGSEASAANWLRDTQSHQPATLRGKVFNDANENKVQDPGEEPLVGWTIFLDANRSGALEPGERSTTTGADGQYVFDNLAPGTYAVAQLLPEGWAQTFPGDSPSIGAATAGSMAGSPGGAGASVLNDFAPVSSTTIIDDISTAGPNGAVASAGSGFAWADHDLSTPDVIDIYYDFRAQNGFANEITSVQRALAEQALAGWTAASGGRLHFIRNTAAAAHDIINIGAGDLEALGYVSGVRHTFGLGGGTFSQVGASRTITDGVVWLDSAETWDDISGNGDITGTADFFSIVSREIGHALGLTTTQTDPNGAAIDVQPGASEFLLFQSHCGCGGLPDNAVKYGSEITTLSPLDRTLIQGLYGAGAGDDSGPGGFYTGNGTGFHWADHDLATPDVIDIYYDFRSLNGYTNQITTAQITLAEQALAGWAAASLGRLHFVRSTDVAISDIINIGTGDIAALGGVSSVGGTLALGGGSFSTIAGQHIVTSGKAWLDFSEAWDVSYFNGNPAGTYDYYSVVAHEIGHALGLGHTDRLPGADIMDGTYSGEKTLFSANDQFLVRTLYAVATPGGGSNGGGTSGDGVTIIPAAALGVHVVTVDFNQSLEGLNFGAEQLDVTPPDSAVTPLPATTTATTFLVSWSGADETGGSGIASYDVYVADNGGAYSLFKTGTTETSTQFTGIVGHTYTFYSVATDIAGNVEAPPAAADASITLVTPVTLQSMGAVTSPRSTTLGSLNVTFSGAIDAASLTAADFTLTRDGGPNLLTGAETITLVAGNTYRINGLSTLTRLDGSYVLTVSAEGVNDLSANPGAGSLSRTWTMNGGPLITAIESVSPNPRETFVNTIDVTFSEPIDLTTFTAADITLKWGSTIQAFGPAQTIDRVGSTSTYRIGGLAPLTYIDGNYALTVSAAAVKDLDGNTGSGSTTTYWSVKRVAPTVKEFTPVAPNPSKDAIDAIEVTFTEGIDPATLTLDDLVLKRGSDVVSFVGSTAALTHNAESNIWQVVGLSSLTGLDGKYTLTVNASGVKDLAGITGKGSKAVSWTQDFTAPTVTAVTKAGPATRNTPIDTLVVTLSEKVQLPTFGIERITLTRNGVIVPLTSAQTITNPSGNNYQINGLAALTGENGQYVLTVDPAGILDLAGNEGVGSKSTTWLVDTLAPVSSIVPFASPTATSLSITLSITGSDPVPGDGSAPSGVKNYDIYVSTDGGAFTFWKTMGASSSSAVTRTTFVGQSDHTYDFYSLARDYAGNVEAKPAASEASIVVPDLSAPATQVTLVDTSHSTFVVTMEGSDVGSNGIVASFDLYVSIDGAAGKKVATLLPGAPVGGVYSATTEYRAISDGALHSYRFYSIGKDGNGKSESAPTAPADVSVSASFAPYQVAEFDVEETEAQRSLVRSLDLVFSRPDDVAAIIASINDSINGNDGLFLKRYNLDGLSPSTLSLKNKLSDAGGGRIAIDFGPEGLTNNGYYELGVDLDGNGTFDRLLHFERLRGDFDGNGIVDGADTSLLMAAVGTPGAPLFYDLNNDGLVTLADQGKLNKLLGNQLNPALLPLDD